jgi:GDP-mannose 6-dehydrogenase
MKISVFGLGYVGAVSSACLASLGHEVIGIDTQQTKVDFINNGQPPIVEEKISEITKKAVSSGGLRASIDAEFAVQNTEISLISVGTPSRLDGSISLTAIDAVAKQIGDSIKRKSENHTVVVRSTVLPGTTEDRIAQILMTASGRRIGDGLNLCFNPEFLREGSSVDDFYNPPFTILGSMTEEGFDILETMYNGLDAQVIRTSCRIAESVKYISNCYHAVKITFANEIGALLKSCQIDARDAMDIFFKDTDLNISRAYLKPGFAFGGSCLPKDLRALLSLGNANNVDLPFLSNILNSNNKHIDRAFSLITSQPRGKIAFFGLSFKPGTDDLRESPLVMLAERLIGRGYELTIVDSNVDIARLTGANKNFIMQEIPHLEKLLARNPNDAIEGANIVVVSHADEEAGAAIKRRADGCLIVDLQGISVLQDMPGVNYEGICW